MYLLRSPGDRGWYDPRLHSRALTGLQNIVRNQLLSLRGLTLNLMNLLYRDRLLRISRRNYQLCWYTWKNVKICKFEIYLEKQDKINWNSVQELLYVFTVLYCALHDWSLTYMFTQVLFLAGNHGNHENWVPSMPSQNLSLMFIVNRDEAKKN